MVPQAVPLVPPEPPERQNRPVPRGLPSPLVSPACLPKRLVVSLGCRQRHPVSPACRLRRQVVLNRSYLDHRSARFTLLWFIEPYVTDGREDVCPVVMAVQDVVVAKVGLCLR